MTNYQAGHDAEKLAAEYLSSHGFAVVELNWKTRWCEIDIVAQKSGIIYFVEVKLRQSKAYGAGFDYITPKKLQQMQFAAEFWVSQKNWTADYRLAALSIDAGEFAFTEIV
jgi:uncharacterized protein (TIGR00252 family)